jgi:hypothetical protein
MRKSKSKNIESVPDYSSSKNFNIEHIHYTVGISNDLSVHLCSSKLVTSEDNSKWAESPDEYKCPACLKIFNETIKKKS